MILRRGIPDDAWAVVALEAELFGVDAWSLALVVSELAAADSSVLVAITSGELVGYAVALRGVGVVDLQRLGVHPGSRRKGLARVLLAETVGHAVAGGAVRMLLEVSAGNEPALALYAGAGFEEIDRRPRYYRDESDALVLALWLASGDVSGE